MASNLAWLSGGLRRLVTGSPALRRFAVLVGLVAAGWLLGAAGSANAEDRAPVGGAVLADVAAADLAIESVVDQTVPPVPSEALPPLTEPLVPFLSGALQPDQGPLPAVLDALSPDQADTLTALLAPLLSVLEPPPAQGPTAGGAAPPVSSGAPRESGPWLPIPRPPAAGGDVDHQFAAAPMSRHWAVRDADTAIQLRRDQPLLFRPHIPKVSPD